MTIDAFGLEATRALELRFWRPFFFTEAVRALQERHWRVHFADEVESLLYLRERAADEVRKRNSQRELLAMKMADMFGPTLEQLGREFGPQMLINGLLDLACGMAATGFPPEHMDANFAAMGQRIADTDWRRHRARFQASQKQRLSVVGGRRTSGGIILPK